MQILFQPPGGSLQPACAALCGHASKLPRFRIVGTVSGAERRHPVAYVGLTSCASRAFGQRGYIVGTF